MEYDSFKWHGDMRPEVIPPPANNHRQGNLLPVKSNTGDWQEHEVVTIDVIHYMILSCGFYGDTIILLVMTPGFPRDHQGSHAVLISWKSP